MFHIANLRTLALAALSALAAIAAAGCADPAVPNFADEPIAELALADGRTLSFYEPEPGAILLSELAPAGMRPLSASGASSVELFARLAPDRPIPDELLAAQARQDAMQREHGLSASSASALVRAHDTTGTSAGVAETGTSSYIPNVHCDDKWFAENFCGYSYDWSLCLLNHWGGAFATAGSVDNAVYTVCADTGPVALSVRMGTGAGGVWSVPAGYYVSFGWLATWLNTSTRGDVIDAAGDRFHYFVGYLF